MQIGKMGSAELVGLAWWMKGVGKQQQTIGASTILGGQHRRHASAIRVSAKEDSAAGERPQDLHGASQARLVFFGRSQRRSLWTPLAKGQIAAKYSDAHAAEGFC